MGETVPMTFRIPLVVRDMLDEQIEADPNLGSRSEALQDAVTTWLMVEQAADG